MKIYYTNRTGHEKQTSPGAYRTTICKLRMSTNFLKKSVSFTKSSDFYKRGQKTSLNQIFW